MKLLFLALPVLAFAQQHGSVEGIAYNKRTKAPVAGVRVRLTSGFQPVRQYDAVTGVDGRYSFDNLPVGIYLPWIVPPDAAFGPSPVESMKKRVQVSDQTTTFDIPITPPSAIHGRVVDPDRQPVARVQVLALSVAGAQPFAAPTDEDGRFNLQLAPGRYQLRVRSPKWATTYYPSSVQSSSAESILVGEAADLGGFEIRLRPLPSVGIRGIVRDPDGKPVPAVSLDLTARTGRTSGDAHVTSGADGAFEFKSVPPADWLITAAAAIRDRQWMGFVHFTMADRDLEHIEVRIHAPFALHAVVEGDTRERRKPFSVSLNSEVGYFGSFANEKDGSIRFDRVYPGAYRVGINGSVPGQYLKSILLGPADVTGRIIDLSPASPPLRIIYAPNGGRVTGEVENGPGAKVFLLSADRDTYVPGTTSAMTLDCDQQGRFGVRDLRPGNWYALAFASLPAFFPTDSLRGRVFGRGLWREAQSFRVAEGETVALKLRSTSVLE